MVNVLILKRMLQRSIKPFTTDPLCSYPDHSTVLYIYPWGQKKLTLYLSSLVEFVLPIELDSPIDTDANDFEAHAVAFIAPSCKFPRFEGYSL
jgi:hypothetical protein